MEFLRVLDGSHIWIWVIMGLFWAYWQGFYVYPITRICDNGGVLAGLWPALFQITSARARFFGQYRCKVRFRGNSFQLHSFQFIVPIKKIINICCNNVKERKKTDHYNYGRLQCRPLRNDIYVKQSRETSGALKGQKFRLVGAYGSMLICGWPMSL